MATLLKLHRFNTTKKSTTSFLTIDGEYFCYALEDPPQKQKVVGLTRIPDGFYEIELRDEISPLTQKYMSRYSYFTRHLQLKDVPNFKHVYLHIGNKPEDSEGCILVGRTSAPDFVGNSAATFERLYKVIQPKLLAGERVYISINDQVQNTRL